MIKRIKSIKSVGNFRNLSASSVQLGKIVLVYGLNGYGKSTLADVLRSLGQNNPGRIKARQTFSGKAAEPKIQLSYINDRGPNERKIEFSGSQWNKPGFKYDIEVFDSIFINQNVFYGLRPSSSTNKELTEFILGDESVRLAKEIYDLRKQQTKVSRQIVDMAKFYSIESAIYSDVTDSLKEKDENEGDLNSQTDSFKNYLKDYASRMKVLDDLKLSSSQLEIIKEMEQLSEKEYELDLFISEKQKKLEDTSDLFAESYFEAVNDLFKDLGGRAYTIKRQSFTYKSHKPAYGFHIDYYGEQIPPERYPYFLSDADRRALALSIFLAKLQKASKSTLGKIIVVLDDPVTSFDENRITYTMRKIDELAKECRQIIIFSHYKDFFKKLHFRLKNHGCSLTSIKIVNTPEGGKLSRFDDVQTEFDEHALWADKIEKFINGEYSEADAIRMKLRIFLQEELEWRYRRQLRGQQYTGVGGLADRLAENNATSQSIISKIRSYNSSLNEIMHHESDYSIEDTRNLATDMFDFLYKELNA